MPATDCWSIYIEKAVPNSSDLEQAKHLIGAGRFEEALRFYAVRSPISNIV